MSSSVSDLNRLSEFLIEEAGKRWGPITSSWSHHQHPEHEVLSESLLEQMETSFGKEFLDRTTARAFLYRDRSEMVDEWTKGLPWKEQEKKLWTGFGCWLWQAHHPTQEAARLFMDEFEWESENPNPRFAANHYLASDVLEAWGGGLLRFNPRAREPFRAQADPLALSLIESIVDRPLAPWGRGSGGGILLLYLTMLNSAGSLTADHVRKALAHDPKLGIDGDDLLKPHFWEVVFEFARELEEDNSHRFCYFSRPSGARWVIRACENVERLGLTTLASAKRDAYDRNHAIRKIADIREFLPSDDLDRFAADLARFSPKTRKLVAGCAKVARDYLLADPEQVAPPSFQDFKEQFLACSHDDYLYFDNSADPTDGLLPVASLRRLADDMGQEWRSQMLEEFAQLGGEGKNALLLLEGLFGTGRKRIEAAMTRGGQAAAKAYGLLPLPEEAALRQKEIILRHERIRRFETEAEKLKKGRRLNALAASQVALGNLAQIAGYASALEMELDLLLKDQGGSSLPEAVEHEAYRAHLAIEPTGPKVVVSKNGRPLKNVPPAVKTLPAFEQLKLACLEQCQQFERFRDILEGRMVQGDTLSKGELAKMSSLPIMAVLLEQVVMLDDAHLPGRIKEGKFLTLEPDHQRPLPAKMQLAHPVELTFAQRELWTDHLAAEGLVPPFPQLQREFYLPEPEELDSTECLRFQGHRLDGGFLLRKLSVLGWSASTVDYPFFHKAYPNRGLRVSLLPGDTIRSLRDADGFLLDGLRFCPVTSADFDHHSPLPLSKVDPVVFSETIRELKQVLNR